MNSSTNHQQAAVGFDIGTTMSVAAYVDASGKFGLINGHAGNPLIPSAVYFCDDVIIGEESFELGIADPVAFANYFKRDMGKPHYHRRVRHRHVPPEVLTAFLIERLRNMASAQIGPVHEAVITVPAYFDERKRTATQRAAELAGVRVQEIINEPTAAAIAYGYDLAERGSDFLSSERPRRLLVYDLGGGTFDVTLLEYARRTFRTYSTDGDAKLGGRDFDEKILDIICQRFEKQHGVDPRHDLRAAQQLWETARICKHAMTENERHTIVFRHDQKQIEFELTREKFEAAIEPLIERTLITCTEVIREVGWGWISLDDILLVGGSSRIPLIVRKLRSLTQRDPFVVENPDELVALGAALCAATKSGDNYLDADAQFEIVNVNAHSLGIAGIDVKAKRRINKILIPRNTPLPASKTRNFVTSHDGQRKVTARLLEGESENPKFCSPLGNCVVWLSDSLPRGTQVEVTCRYDTNGTISVSAFVPASQESAHVDLRRDQLPSLDSLETWRNRLLVCVEADVRPPRPAAKPPLKLPLPPREDVSAILRRLDEMYTHIGTHLCRNDVHQRASLTFGFYRRLQHEIDAFQSVIARLEKTYQSVATFEQRATVSSRLAHVRIAVEQSRKLSHHCRIVIGRECVAANVVPAEAREYLDEIRQLEAMLQGAA